jgi:hypothetical protein
MKCALSQILATDAGYRKGRQKTESVLPPSEFDREAVGLLLACGTVPTIYLLVLHFSRRSFYVYMYKELLTLLVVFLSPGASFSRGAKATNIHYTNIDLL